jgi:glycosyltransferase involved in cell wall biosynthesis
VTSVLLLSPSAKAGGAERAFAALARSLPAAGIDPVAALLDEGPLEDWLAEAGCSTAVLRAGRTRQLHRTVATVARLRRLAADSGAAAIVSSMSKGHVYGGAAAAARLPAVWWQHGIPARSRIEAVAARVPAAAIVCVSAASAGAQLRLTPRRRVVTINPGVPLERVRAARGAGAAIKRRLGWDGVSVVGIVGRLQPDKGQELFLRAAAELAAAHVDVRFVVVGGAVLGWEGDYPERLRSLAAELGLGERIHFAGHQDDPYAWLDALDVVVQPAANDSFGLVVVEAMALGKPVVAVDAGGTSELVHDGVSALLVPQDPRALASAVGRVLADEALRDRLAAGGELRAEVFSEERTALAFARLLQELAPAPRASRLQPGSATGERS